MNLSVMHQSSWGKTSLGTPLELYQKIHAGQAPWLFIGGVHGDEPEGVRLAEELLKWLIDAEKKQKIPERSWILIPCLNVDGYQQQQRTNGRGVDLNRNFPTHDWSPDSKGARYYPGVAPSSENETQCLVELIEKVKPEVIFHFHSWKPSIVYTGDAGAKWAQFFSNDFYPAQPDIGYPTPGSLGQYGWYQHKTPVICIEEKAGMKLDRVWENFRPGFERMFLS